MSTLKVEGDAILALLHLGRTVGVEAPPAYGERRWAEAPIPCWPAGSTARPAQPPTATPPTAPMQATKSHTNLHQTSPETYNTETQNFPEKRAEVERRSGPPEARTDQLPPALSKQSAMLDQGRPTMHWTFGHPAEGIRAGGKPS
ncbi:hypothetical protein Bbelb_360650 [Branchiostoma belcheri]|nr:hypothetical protein Bbelb_410500 [Branchiostoma belcheri]KAI8486165.1 hypothetical protein Bbelb_360650 [Branchiostoma belcheri]